MKTQGFILVRTAGRRITLRLVRVARVLILHWFVVGGYKRSREGRASQVSETGEKVECSRLSSG